MQFSWLLVAVSVAAVVGILLALYREALPKGEASWGHAVLVGLVLIACLAIFGSDRTLVNVLYPILLIGVILAAVQARSEAVLNLGLAFFVVEIVGRYFDFLFDQLNPGLFFIGGGLLLLGLAFAIQRLRRRLAQQVRGESSG